MKRFLRRRIYIRAFALPRKRRLLRLAEKPAALLLAALFVFFPVALSAVGGSVGLEAVSDAVCLLEFGARPHSYAALPDETPPPVQAPVHTVSPSPTAVPSPAPPPLTSEGIAIKGETAGINVAALFAEPLALAENAQILIIHTHSTEAYAPDGSYVETSEARTLDEAHNVVRVGDELAAELEKRGFTVVHDRGRYDYPSYEGAYSRSGASAAAHLKENPNIKIIIDLHRDAGTDADGSAYRTAQSINGESTSRLMLVVGTGSAGLQNPHYRENLKLALRLQAAMNAQHSALARPISLSADRYNQHLSSGSLLLEVGSSGDTLEEALAAVKLFAKAAARVLG